jgi:hypothetical protein
MPSIKKPPTPKNKNPSDLVCEMWRISIADSVTDAMRGEYYYLQETYFPELNMSLNCGGYSEQLNVLLSPNNRYNRKDPKTKLSIYEEDPICESIILLEGDDAEEIRGLYEKQKAYEDVNAKAKEIYRRFTSLTPLTSLSS